jgi:hypothetical protein
MIRIRNYSGIWIHTLIQIRDPRIRIRKKYLRIHKTLHTSIRKKEEKNSKLFYRFSGNLLYPTGTVLLIRFVPLSPNSSESWLVIAPYTAEEFLIGPQTVSIKTEG